MTEFHHCLVQNGGLVGHVTSEETKIVCSFVHVISSEQFLILSLGPTGVFISSDRIGMPVDRLQIITNKIHRRLSLDERGRNSHCI